MLIRISSRKTPLGPVFMVRVGNTLDCFPDQKWGRFSHKCDELLHWPHLHSLKTVSAVSVRFLEALPPIYLGQ